MSNAVLAREAVGDPAQTADNRAQRAVVHVHDPAPCDAAGVYVELVTPVDMIVGERGEQIVGHPDGVEIAGEVQG